MFLAPPLKSSAAIRAASTEPMPLVSWKMPEISLSTPTRTTLSEISACADPPAAHDNASARPNFGLLIVVLPFVPYFFSFQSGYPIRSKEASPSSISGHLCEARSAPGPAQGAWQRRCGERNRLPKNEANRFEATRPRCDEATGKLHSSI